MPNAAKAETIESLKQRLDGAHSAVLTDYRGLTVRQISDLRKQLKGVAAEYKVVKNRLAAIAVRGGALDLIAPHLKGPVGLAFTKQDPVAVAKALQVFVRANPTFTIRLGLVEGKVVPPEGLRSLAELPSKEALRSQLVGAIEGPMSQIVSLLQAPMRDLAYILSERSKQEGAAPAAPVAAEPVAAAAAPAASTEPAAEARVEAASSPELPSPEPPSAEAPSAAPAGEAPATTA